MKTGEATLLDFIHISLSARDNTQQSVDHVGEMLSYQRSGQNVDQ